MQAKNIVIIGGGIAGLSCLDSLLLDFNPNAPQYSAITLISEGGLVKKITNYKVGGRNLEQFDVQEYSGDDIIDRKSLPDNLSFRFITGRVDSIDNVTRQISILKHSIHNDKPVIGEEYDQLAYDIICLCSGSRPRVLKFPSQSNHPELEERLIIIRDTTTIRSLQKKLTRCKRLAIVGNGGIGLELVHKVSSCDKIWIIKDESIGFTFFDSGASKFLLEQRAHATGLPLNSQACRLTSNTYSSTPLPEAADTFGPSLGPNWSDNMNLQGQSSTHNLNIIYSDEVDDIVYDAESEHPVIISTTKGQKVCCDLVALAIGVEPNRIDMTSGHLSSSKSDGGILIDDQMRTSLDGIYAAGDVVSCERWPKNDLWFQMRLWTQARHMGFYAGRCIAAHLTCQDPSLYFNFDCFTHCTRFFNQKLVLIGRFNGQNLTDEESKACEVTARVIRGKDYIKLLLKNNRIIGAVLIGDTGLEETIENLVHDQIDVSHCKDGLLDGCVDIEDYFD